MTAIEWIVAILCLIGGFLSLVGGIGFIRFPDVYGRTHSATKSATLGVITVMVGTFLYFLFAEGMFSGKILLTILFVFLTAPLAALMVSRAAYRTGVPLSKLTTQDDLKKKYPEARKDVN
ncbi:MULTISPECIES: monovalent cation/H(+) antiporter subunit G [Exiguobacterium]|uniref:monovalent cation/H(+) antiporter subunit G n=1 Tax=Exiguobacterium TaxID=33986 RepID=UPI001BEB41BA|nr:MULTISPECIES: monovalent cation/H(+) antiporter subunit G [Exiguobacterium]MCT4784178.1 monovalent cation/H(+) antiporter subunit G [Exiguobacterium himgiriensis]